MMKQRILICLTTMLMMVSALFAQMNLWQNGKITWSVETEQVDSLTFVPQSAEAELTFSFTLKDAWHIQITPSRNDVDYIWVATSDADYVDYNYSSYEEAWQTTVDIAKKWGALEEWEMINRGPTTLSLTDNTWNADHYVLAVATWDGEKRTSALSTYEFTWSETGVVAMNTALMQLWKAGTITETIQLSNVDSITFGESELESMFTLSVTDITNISFRATVVPIDEQMYYYVDYVSKSVVDEYTDEAFAQAYLAQLLDSWRKYDPKKDFADVYLYQGTKTLRFSEGVMGDTDYYLVCFAVDVTDKNAPKLASGLYKQAFTTEPTPTNPDLTFEVTVNEKYVATIIPSDDISTYYWTTFNKADLSQYGTPEDVWKANAARYGNTYSSHGKESFSIVYQFMDVGTVYLAVAGWDGKQTTQIYTWEFEVTEDMLPF